MISLDIETSGGSPIEYGIWQIGAIELENPENQFLEEARIDEEDKIDDEALIITGKAEEELRDRNKQSQKEMIGNFFKWVDKIKMKNLLCHLPEFDQGFLRHKAKKYFNTDPFWPDYHRAFDLHTIAQTKFHEINGKFLTKEDSNSDMGLNNIMKLCGINIERKKLENGKITREGKPHNAIEDAKLTAECFYRIMFGKNLFSEFSKFEIPEELKKNETACN